ncbi:Hypothetical predicted protein [Octopus vulgaris]|uniref:Uncharacterized protein n=1 Tax=Octopus vulgaris TaxID=6645 RepID=A0AA36B439_OCTVU|nr:Hypothetical predicted protein [Octopus vulgaris]
MIEEDSFTEKNDSIIDDAIFEDDGEIIENKDIKEESLTDLLDDIRKVQENLPETLTSVQQTSEIEKPEPKKFDKRKSCRRLSKVHKNPYILKTAKSSTADENPIMEELIDDIIFDFCDWVEETVSALEEHERKYIMTTLTSFFELKAILSTEPEKCQQAKFRCQVRALMRLKRF